VLRGRQVGIAHAKIDDVAPFGPSTRTHRVDFGDDVGRQALDTVEVFFHPGAR